MCAEVEAKLVEKLKEAIEISKRIGKDCKELETALSKLIENKKPQE